MTPAAPFLIMDADQDNVATALRDLPAGTELALRARGAQRTVRLRQDVPFGHKFAAVDIPAGAPVIKYGAVMGTASQAIAAGEHAHVHNVESNRGRGDRGEAAAR